jgi:hypothetical protein
MMKSTVRSLFVIAGLVVSLSAQALDVSTQATDPSLSFDAAGARFSQFPMESEAAPAVPTGAATAFPEPATSVLLLAGLLVLGAALRRRSRR